MKIYQAIVLSLFTYCCNSKIQHDADHIMYSKSDKQTIKTNAQLNEITYTSGDVVSCGLLDRNGNLWFGTSKHGIYHYKDSKFTNITKEDGLCSNEISSILEDKDGILWLGTSDGLCTFNSKDFVHISIPSNDIEGDKTVLGLFQDKNENIWIGTWGNGAFRYNGKSFEPFLNEAGRLNPKGNYNNVIRNFIQDDDGNIWISSLSHGGITRYDGSDFINYNEGNGLCDDMAFASFIDSQGHIWIGGSEEGVLCKYNGETFTHYSKSDGICDGFVTCFYEDKDGNIWMGSESENSVCIYDKRQFNLFSVEGSEKMKAIRFIIEDGNGIIWMGGRFGGLWSYDGKTLVDYTQTKNE